MTVAASAEQFLYKSDVVGGCFFVHHCAVKISMCRQCRYSLHTELYGRAVTVESFKAPENDGVVRHDKVCAPGSGLVNDLICDYLEDILDELSVKKIYPKIKILTLNYDSNL